MDTETEDLHLQKLQEFVHDDDKIVTIPFLAKTLNISIQESMELIKKYVEDQQKLKEKIGITRILTGILKDGNQKVVMMVKDSEIDEKIHLFSEIISRVIFSVQKSMKIDFGFIALVDQLDRTNLREKPLAGTIIGKNCTKRVLNFKKLPPLPAPSLKGKSSFFVPTGSNKSSEKQSEPSKSDSKVKSTNCKSSEKQSESTKSDSKSKSNGITNMFNNISSQNNSKDKPTTSSNGTKQTTKPKGGLSSFLSKTTSKSTSSKTPENNTKSLSDKENSLKTTSSECFDSQESIKIEDLTSFMEVDVEDSQKDKECPEPKEDEELREKKKELKNDSGRKESKNKKTKSIKRQRDQSAGKETKRRKRIVVRDDSDSEDMFGNDEENEDVIAKSDDEPERIPSPALKNSLAPKNKRRKAIDKTYVDEEGFVVTQTEYVLESASEDEKETEMAVIKEEVKTKKPKEEKKSSVSSENDSSPQKAAKGKKGKKNAAVQNQPTLMNFFKKK